jgi:hypothetical protein
MTKPKPKQTNGIPLEARVIRSISDFEAPKTTQDAVDKAAAEYMTANLLRQYAVKRYDRAKAVITDNYEDKLTEIKAIATRNMSKSTYTVVGADWQVVLNANKPVTVQKAEDLRTALIKRGVKADLIDEAMEEIKKYNQPAVSIEATPTMAD